MSSAKQGLRRASIGGLAALVGASIAAVGLAAGPAQAAFDPTPGISQIGIVDKNTSSAGSQGATLIYPGKTAQALDDVQLLIPNKFTNGDTIRLALYDRAAGSQTAPTVNNNGQINADADHKIVFSGTPKATAVATPFKAGSTEGPTSATATDVQNHAAANLHGNASKPAVPPTFTASLVQSSRANGLGPDEIDLTVNNQNDANDPNGMWAINVSGLQVDLGAGATPGELRLVPFAYNGNPNSGLTNWNPMFGNIELNALGITIVNQYTVPAYISPVTFDVASPSNVAADNITTAMGDITIAETNNFSLQDGNYRVTVNNGVDVRNSATDPVTVSLVGGASNETVSSPAVVVPGPNGGFQFHLDHTGGLAGLLAQNSTKVKVVVHGLLLASPVAQSFTYTMSGGSVGPPAGNGQHVFLTTAGTSTEIPAGYGAFPAPPWTAQPQDGNDRKGVQADSAFFNGTASQVNQTDIVAPVLTFPGHAVSLPDRIGGQDRYETAAKIALADNGCANVCPNHIGPQNQNIVVASGENFPDALSANYLATSLGTDILLVRQNKIPQPTIGALRQLGTVQVYIVGGTGAVSQAVQNQLEGMLEYNSGGDGVFGSGVHLQVTRLSGPNRYDTNLQVNEYAAANSLYSASVGSTNITFGVSSKRTALVATGADYPDALSSGAAVDGAAISPVGAPIPLILTNGSALSGQASSQMNALGIEQAVIVGGTGVVSDAVASSLTSGGAAVKRVSGADRYATAAALADFEVAPALATSSKEGGLGFDPGTGDDEDAVLATGEDFADALAGGPFAAFNFGNPAPILLTRTAALSAPTQTWLQAHASTYIDVQALGLAGAVSNAALAAANLAIS